MPDPSKGQEHAGKGEKKKTKLKQNLKKPQTNNKKPHLNMLAIHAFQNILKIIYISAVRAFLPDFLPVSQTQSSIGDASAPKYASRKWINTRKNILKRKNK